VEEEIGFGINKKFVLVLLVISLSAITVAQQTGMFNLFFVNETPNIKVLSLTNQNYQNTYILQVLDESGQAYKIELLFQGQIKNLTKDNSIWKTEIDTTNLENGVYELKIRGCDSKNICGDYQKTFLTIQK
jgi:hypothetical protein